MKVVLYTLLAITLLSCSSKDEKLEALTKDKVAKMTSDEVVRDLLIENDGDYEQLGRIFKCSVNTIKRVEKKETYLTENALKEFKNLLVSVKVVGKDSFKENDPYYDSWIRSFRYWLNKYVFWGVGVFVLFFIMGLSGVSEFGAGAYIDTGVFVIFVGGYLVTWIGNMIWSYDIPTYLTDEKINPIIEVLF